MKSKRQQYEVFNHRIVWQAAARNLCLVDSGNRDGKYFTLGARVLTFFAFEGYLNWLGELIFPDMWQSERNLFTKPPHAGTLGKHQYLREYLGLPPLPAKDRPLSTAIMLHRVRNFLAHTKPERGERTVEFSFPEFPPTYDGFLNAVCTPDAAQISMDDIRVLANQLHEESKIKHPELVPEAEPFCGLLNFQTTDM